MITIDITMVIQIINILVLILALNVVLYRPVRTMLAKREERINILGKEIDTFHENAVLRQQEIDRKLQEARAKAKDELEESRSNAQTTGNEILTKNREEANAAKAEQMKGIQEQFASARDNLKEQVDGFASEIAGKILGRSV